MCQRIEADLPEPFHHTLAPLFEALPLQSAMQDLVVNGHRAGPDAKAACANVVASDELREHPAVCAGLWLYVDALDEAEALLDDLHTPTGRYWHAILLRRKGELDASRKWYQKAGNHPAMQRFDLSGGPGGGGSDVGQFDPIAFLDRVEASREAGRPSPDLLAVQRKEWSSLLAWCAEN